MKNKLLALLLSSLLSFALNAEAKKEANHPCLKLRTACESAGYKRGEHKDKKGLRLDCMKPLLEGQSVNGVTVNPEDITACKNKQAEVKAKREAKKNTK